MKKICFISSSGGHYEQLSTIVKKIDQYDSFVVTEKVSYDLGIKNKRIYFLQQINRKSILFPFIYLRNYFKSRKIFKIENPDIVISTGVLATISFCKYAKKKHKKIIYIESFAKINSPTKTGKLMYKYADVFIVQWPEMLKVYPNAVCFGGVY